MIGPYFIDEIEPGSNTLNTKRYCKLLVDDVIPALEGGLGNEFNSCYFQQDGAGPHRGLQTRGLLQRNFGRRLIALDTACDNPWPAHSPDLNPLDYWFWSMVKRFVNGHEYETLEELKCIICLVCSHITPEDVRNAISDLPVRLSALAHAKGRHFEYTFKKFKRDRLGEQPCPSCDNFHLCDCPNCDENCLTHQIRQRLLIPQEHDDSLDQDMDVD